MLRSVVQGTLAGGLLIVASACGDATKIQPLAAGVPGTGESEQTVIVPTPETIAVPPLPLPTVPLPTNISVPSDTAAMPVPPVLPALGPPTTDPWAGVTIDDPFPPQLDAVADPGAAETAVRYGYMHWILVDLDHDLRVRLMENGEVNAENIAAEFEKNRGLISPARIAVDSVQFTDAEHALVQFQMRLTGGGTSGYYPNPITGGAVFADGTWRIDRHTLCYLAFGAGLDCAGNGKENPTPPPALQVIGLPADLSPVSQMGTAADVFANIVTVPGQGAWSSVQGTTLIVTTQALRGSTLLEPADAVLVLTTPRFQVVDGNPVSVGDGPGRVQTDGVSVRLAFIRADDVVVTMQATGLGESEVIAIAASMQPTDQTPPPYDGPVTVTIVPPYPPTFSTAVAAGTSTTIG